MGLHFKVLAS